MAERMIQAAEFSAIENRLDAAMKEIDGIAAGLGDVDAKIVKINDELSKLAADFKAYIRREEFENNKLEAQDRLKDVRSEIENKYGQYNRVRKTTTDILHEDDLETVRRAAVTDAGESVMIETPGYWLAPCLAALAAWINDQPELAEKAVKEAVRRNDEKTSLFFALVCRSAGRGDAGLKWVQRYLGNQKAEDLNRNTVIILEAYASGLFGADSEGVVSTIITEWLDNLVKNKGFAEQQRDQWSRTLIEKKKKYDTGSYSYLPKYSSTWPLLVQVMEGAELHAIIVDYFMDIFEKEVSAKELKEQLDKILESLVSDFEEEETSLYKQEKLNELIIEYDGDRQRAMMNTQMEEKPSEERRDFAQLVTDSAIRPEISQANSSAQKASIALTKDWIKDAYSDITEKNRKAVPSDIRLEIGTFSAVTRDGTNGQVLEQEMRSHFEAEKKDELAKNVLTSGDTYSMYAGILISASGIGMLAAGFTYPGLIAIIAGIGIIIRYFSKKKNVEQARQKIMDDYASLTEENLKILRALLAEVYDFRDEFSEKDAVYDEVIEFLDQISPDQYVRKVSGSATSITGQA